MTIIRHGKDWNLPIYILASYVAIGFVIIFLLPDKFVSINILHIYYGLFGRISAISENHARASFFCACMTALYPIFFLLFSAFAPVKLKGGAKADFQTIITLIFGFVLFGMISSFYLVHYIIVGDISANPTSRLGRLAYEMAQDNFSLFIGASLLLSVTMMTMWFSFIAIPVAIFKLASPSKKITTTKE